ncbi:hypothetical protein GCM10009535_09780 [Streptomyces thermocarboxydovorans]|uniref:Uncharacterized protein n=1 Tax=Streptomyces thermocarboxydovorans TaxID=59298 RepID=A0ABP3SIG2_9ACTN
MYAAGSSRTPCGISTDTAGTAPSAAGDSTAGSAPSTVSRQRLRWRASQRNRPSGDVPRRPVIPPDGLSAANVPSLTRST